MLGGVLRSLWSSVYFVFLPSICISSGLCLGVIRTAAGSQKVLSVFAAMSSVAFTYICHCYCFRSECKSDPYHISVLCRSFGEHVYFSVSADDKRPSSN